ncbi:MAG: sialate O-acetylesterase [Paracoccaceae bacterium]
MSGLRIFYWWSMIRSSFFVLLVCGALAASLGVYVGASTSMAPEMLSSTKRTVRKTLDLPKFWADPVLKLVGEHQETPCPDPADTIVLVTGGQSNAANSNSSLSVTTPTDRVYSWFREKCYVAKDPVPGANGTLGSLWPAVGKALAESTGQNIMLVNGGIGGTEIADWLDARSGYLEALLDRVGQAQSHGYEPDVIVWHQGETDAATGTTRAAYADYQRQLGGKLLDAMPEATLYLFQASKCTGQNRANGVQQILDAQSDAVQTLLRAQLGMNTDELGNDFRWDTCHFNSLGRDAISRRVAYDLAALIAQGKNGAAGP